MSGSTGSTGSILNQTGWNAFDPLNVFGNSGSSVLKNLIDPGNIDSGPNGLNLFGQRPKVTPGGPSNLPTLDGNLAAGLSGNYAPQFFTSLLTPYQSAPSPGAGMMNFNDMAQQLAGPQYGFGTFGPSPSVAPNNMQPNNTPPTIPFTPPTIPLMQMRLQGRNLPYSPTFNRRLV